MRKPKPDPNICNHCGGHHPLTEEQCLELVPQLLAIFARLGGTAEFQRAAYSAWVEVLPSRFDYAEVTGPHWFLEQAHRDVDRFVRLYGVLRVKAQPGRPEVIQ